MALSEPVVLPETVIEWIQALDLEVSKSMLLNAIYMKRAEAEKAQLSDAIGIAIPFPAIDGETFKLQAGQTYFVRFTDNDSDILSTDKTVDNDIVAITPGVFFINFEIYGLENREAQIRRDIHFTLYKNGEEVIATAKAPDVGPAVFKEIVKLNRNENLSLTIHTDHLESEGMVLDIKGSGTPIHFIEVVG